MDFPPLNGLRVVMHVLVIAIHTLAFRSFFIREHGALHEAILQSPVSSAINCAGAASVDGFFLLSGLLLVRTMARLRDESDVARFLVQFAPRRFVRLSLLIACYVCTVTALDLETCTLGQGLDAVFLLVQFQVFTPRWKSLWTYLWSASADFWQQCALAMVLAVGTNLWGPLLSNRRLATATLALVAAASVGYRACVFDSASASYWLLVKHAHIVSVIGNDEAAWLAAKYRVRLTASGPGGLALNGTTDDFQRTFAVLYAAPLARIAPMALGGIAGLWMDSADAHVPHPRVVHGLCALVLALGAVPVDRAVFATSWGVQFFATVLGHVWFSAPLAVALVSVLNTSSNLFAPRLARALSWSGFSPLAEAAYASYIVHPLVLYAVNFRLFTPETDYESMEQRAGLWTFFVDVGKSTAATAVLALAIGSAATRMVQKPVLAWLDSRCASGRGLKQD